MNHPYMKPVEKVLLDMGSFNVTTSAWVQVTAALAQPNSAMEIFNGSGSVLRVSLGAAGLEAASELNYYVLPGKTSPLIPVNCPRGSRVSVRAADADAVDGSLVINCFG